MQRPLCEHTPPRRDWTAYASVQSAGQGATTLGQWLTAVLSMKGESDAMTVPAAVEMIRATPAGRRSEFASEIWAKRMERGTDKTGVPF